LHGVVVLESRHHPLYYEDDARSLTDNATPVRDSDFDRLFRAEAQPLFAFLVWRVGNPSIAEELVADAFERAFRARGRFDQRRGTERAWLYSIALNCVRDHVRRSAAEVRALERTRVRWETAAGEGAWESADARDVVQRALQVLSAEEREVVALRFGADLTLPEIAKVLGERRTTVEGRLYRGLRKMRAHVE
jgi:RNA polymerase sigma factor (sigma-70 family)